MELIQTLLVLLLFAARILLTSSYGIPYPDRTPGICGGYCKGTTGIGILLGPCHEYSFTLDEEKKKENDACEWANDHCCPPNGNGSEWTTTTTTTTLGTTTTDTTTFEVYTFKDDDDDKFDDKIEEIKRTLLLEMLFVACGICTIYIAIGICIYYCLKSPQQQNQPVMYQYQPVIQPQPLAPVTPVDPSKV